ncbi:MAG: hypothetical protein WEE66_06375 [Actinomycetota bacterium]
MIQGECNVIDRSLALVSLTIRPQPQSVLSEITYGVIPAPGRLQSDLLREVRLPKLEQMAHDEVRRIAKVSKLGNEMLAELGLAPLGVYSNDAAEILKLAPTYGVKRGRKGYGDDFYRWIARTYLDLSGTDGSIFAELADAAFKEGIVKYPPIPATAKKWAWEARRRQFLGAATRGRRSTTPGPRLDDDLTEPSEK